MSESFKQYLTLKKLKNEKHEKIIENALRNFNKPKELIYKKAHPLKEVIKFKPSEKPKNCCWLITTKDDCYFRVESTMFKVRLFKFKHRENAENVFAMGKLIFDFKIESFTNPDIPTFYMLSRLYDFFYIDGVVSIS